MIGEKFNYTHKHYIICFTTSKFTRSNVWRFAISDTIKRVILLYVLNGISRTLSLGVSNSVHNICACCYIIAIHIRIAKESSIHSHLTTKVDLYTMLKFAMIFCSVLHTRLKPIITIIVIKYCSHFHWHQL